MNKLTTLFFSFLLITSCSEEFQSDIESQGPSTPAFTRTDINNFIQNHISKGKVFEWETASTTMIHNAAQLSDQIIAIGYTVSSLDNMETIYRDTRQASQSLSR